MGNKILIAAIIAGLVLALQLRPATAQPVGAIQLRKIAWNWDSSRPTPEKYVIEYGNEPDVFIFNAEVPHDTSVETQVHEMSFDTGRDYHIVITAKNEFGGIERSDTLFLGVPGKVTNLRLLPESVE